MTDQSNSAGLILGDDEIDAIARRYCYQPAVAIPVRRAWWYYMLAGMVVGSACVLPLVLA